MKLISEIETTKMEAERVDVKKLKDISFFELSEEKTLKWLSQEKKKMHLILPIDCFRSKLDLYVPWSYGGE